MGVSVTGIGEVTAKPDMVDLALGVSVLGDSVVAATKTAGESAQAVISALTGGGVREEDIVTSQYSIRPEYDYSGNEQRLLGYRVDNIVRARLRDLSRIGDLIDVASAVGGDHTRIDGLDFAVADPARPRESARAAAWQDAMARATQLAALAGRRLGPATSITEVVRHPVMPMRIMADVAMAKEAGTPIQPGSTTVTVELAVEFALED